MTNEFSEIFSVGERNFGETLEKASSVARICAAMASESTRTSVKVMGDGAALAGALLTARDLQEAASVQASYARKSYEDYVSNATKLGALWIDLWKEVYPGFSGK